jgi:hypothetical protein
MRGWSRLHAINQPIKQRPAKCSGVLVPSVLEAPNGSPLNRAPTCSSVQIVLSQHRHRVGDK